MDYPSGLCEQRLSKHVFICCSVCCVKRDVSPTYAWILEDHNFWGINQNTCSECTLFQRHTWCPNGFMVSKLFVSPLESSLLYEINLMIAPVNDLSMQMLHGTKVGSNIQRNKRRRQERGKSTTERGAGYCA